MSGIPKPLRLRIEERAVVNDDGCWIWTGPTNQWGYGQLSVKMPSGKIITRRAHRTSYEVFVGPIPEGLVLDHLCGVILCVNPDHLEPVTQAENVRRHLAWKGHWNANKTHCVNGHEFTPENTKVNAKGHRICRACLRPIQAAAQRRFRARQRAARLAAS